MAIFSRELLQLVVKYYNSKKIIPHLLMIMLFGGTLLGILIQFLRMILGVILNFTQLEKYKVFITVIFMGPSLFCGLVALTAFLLMFFKYFKDLDKIKSKNILKKIKNNFHLKDHVAALVS
jgi:hypothetical protein